MAAIEMDEEARLTKAIANMRKILDYLERNDDIAVNFIERIERVAGELDVIEDKVMEVVSDYSDLMDHSLYSDDD